MPRWLTLPEQGRHDRMTIDTFRCREPAKFCGRRQKINERGEQVAGRSRLNLAGPTHDKRGTRAAFVKHPLVPAQSSRAAEWLDKLRVGAVVGAENYQSPVIDAEVLQFLHHAADIPVSEGNHRSVVLDLLRPRLPGENRILRDDVVPVRRGPCGITEEGPVFVLLDKTESLVGDAGGSIVRPRVFARLLDGHFDTVTNQIVGVVVVSVFLVIVTEEHIEALFLRYSGGFRIAQAPFAEATGSVTGVLQHTSDRGLAGGECEQADFALVGATQNMTGMLACHQHHS